MKIHNKHIIGILISVVVGVIVVYKTFNPLHLSFFPKCPIKQITGYDCPGCGNQRALHEILNGNIFKAFKYNPLTFFLIPYLLIGFIIQFKPQPSTSILKLRKILYGEHAIIVVFLIITIFTIVRNID